MAKSSKSTFRNTLELLFSSIPWLLAMYFFYWLDSSGTWTPETPHRGKLSVVLLGSGMLVSFFIWSWLRKRRS